MRARRSPRLPDFDYSTPGAYFVTICARNRTRFFGDVLDGRVRLTRAGRIVAECWAELPLHLEGVSLDVFVVRPDHLHAIVHLQPIEPPRSLVTVIQAFKSAATKRLGAAVGRGRPPTSIWQRSFFDRVIRNDAELAALRGYVVDNPAALSARLGLWSEPDAPDL